MPRKPKGTYVRDGMAYFDGNVGICGGAYNFGQSQAGQIRFVTLTLFNNSTTGVQLDVWGYDGVNDGDVGAVWDYTTSSAGTVVNNATSIVAGGPVVPGVLLLNTTTVSTPFFGNNTLIPNPLGGIDWSLDGGGAQASHPLWSVPPNWGLRVGPLVDTGQGAFTFWFTYLETQ